jgi:hypothetical protein
VVSSPDVLARDNSSAVTKSARRPFQNGAAANITLARASSQSQQNRHTSPDLAARILAPLERDYIGPALYMSVHRCRHPAETPE